MKVLILFLVICSALCGVLQGGPGGGFRSSGGQIEEIRRWVVLNRNKFDPKDVDDILHGPDWHVTRYFHYLGGQAKLTDVKKLMGETLMWRASMKLSSWKPEDFPCEFWLAGYLQLTRDRQGGPVLAIDPRPMGTYSGDLRTAWYTFHHFQIEYIDKQAAINGTGWKFIMSFAGVQLHNLADVSGIITQYAKGTDRYPGFFRGMFVLEMPPLIETAVRMILSMFSPRTRDAFKFLQERERFFVVKKRDMPEHFGGRLPVSRGLMMVHFPKLLTDCVPLREMARRKGWSERSVKEFLDNTRHLINYNAQQLNFRKHS